jgi:hypothetical protein
VGEGTASRPGRSLLPGKTRYLLYRRLGGPQGRSEQVRKISPPPGFDPRDVQSVPSRYIDYAIRPTIANVRCVNFQKSAYITTYLNFAQYIRREGKETTDFQLIGIQCRPFLPPLVFYVTGYVCDGQMHLKHKA